MKKLVGQHSLNLILRVGLVALFVVGLVGNGWGLSDPNAAHRSFFTEPLPDILCDRWHGGKSGKSEILKFDYSKTFHAKIRILEPPVRAPEINPNVNKVHVQVLEVLKGEVPVLSEGSGKEFYLYFGTPNHDQPPSIIGYIGKRPIGKVFYILGKVWMEKIFTRPLQIGQLHLSKLKACVQKESIWIPEWLSKWWNE